VKGSGPDHQRLAIVNDLTMLANAQVRTEGRPVPGSVEEVRLDACTPWYGRSETVEPIPRAPVPDQRLESKVRVERRQHRNAALGASGLNYSSLSIGEPPVEVHSLEWTLTTTSPRLRVSLVRLRFGVRAVLPALVNP
jgi:hypothetical protein